ncbi:argininosuccinate lyase [Candidatus Roizmanbacteria bacterium RIFCSPHIGHO2_02_FULL_37_13b]|uniref:Argininosuccinate lyase n=1 Tax=Candidatus Roizmanbacteria bacterium RIFCSPLOWO2_02_FULL_36_11 TaxID=1802071 RepID=A0A1F7JCH3_9BACT|nr:MAG: argininosuccinate lyase [Candidatus Roizmanbacteria bacterium RIFCSPHIGHO2_02_FULL_37_13b]OGK53299.1 MAG: argininosuccinate lyase [Candidatus Roizmanbacteria bacterium RIFCSPLOWO2_02_FULL_36_11]
MAKKISQLWGSAFEKTPLEEAVEFCAGRDVQDVKAADYALIPYDIAVNKAHALMLSKQKIIGKDDVKIILKGLCEIEKLANNGQFILHKEKEDVHTNIESWLIDNDGIEKVGKLHTARSRNDQVVCDVRLYLKDQVLNYVFSCLKLVEMLNQKAKQYQTTVMPGFTHHQHAMITTFGHILLGFSSMILRDIEKFMAFYQIIDKNPLGNAASYGTSFNIDRNLTTQLLGFAETDENSLDAITCRYEPEADVAYCITSLMTHLSIMSETLIVLSMKEFGMLEISDLYSTGSSIMPQKKNPDTLEVIKGKTAYAQGLLQSLLMSGKGAFIGYNRDSQWTKYIIMDIINETTLAPNIMAGIISELKVNEQRMMELANKGFIGATSLLEIFCQEYNIPFRSGKIVIEKAIKYSQNKDKIDFEGFKKATNEEKINVTVTKEQITSWQDPLNILNKYLSAGSPGKRAMNSTIKAVILKHTNQQLWLKNKHASLLAATLLLDKEIKQIIG